MYLTHTAATFSGRHSTKGEYDAQNARASFHYIARAGTTPAESGTRSKP